MKSSDQNPSFEERRRYDRVQFMCQAKLKKEKDGDTCYTATISNMSGGGLGLSNRDPFSVGETVFIEIDIPETAEVVIIKGIIRWEKDQSGQRSCGIEFVETLPECLLHFICDKVIECNLGK